MITAADIEWLDEPVIGTVVRTRSRKFGTESHGIYVGVLSSEWDDSPYHYFVGGSIGEVAQGSHGFPATPDTEVTGEYRLGQLIAYSDELVRLVREDLANEPERYGSVKSWTDLHDVCDANEYLILADEKFGLPEDDFGTDERLALANTAIVLAERMLFPGEPQS